jgi:multisubunit Na+/H+ antiporter MnhF subunit
VNVWLLGSIVLLLGGLVPAGWMAARGGPVDRLIGLEMGGTVTALELMLFSQAENEPQYLVVPLVLAVLSFAGTLENARLLRPRP